MAVCRAPLSWRAYNKSLLLVTKPIIPWKKHHRISYLILMIPEDLESPSLYWAPFVLPFSSDLSTVSASMHSLRHDNLAPLTANTQCLAGCSLPQPAPAPVLRCWSSWKHQVGPAEAMSTAPAARREELLPWGNNSPWQPAEPRLWQGSWKPTPAKTRLLAPLWLLRVTQFKTKI